MKLNDMTLGDTKIKPFASQEFLHFHQTLLQKDNGGFRGRKKKASHKGYQI